MLPNPKWHARLQYGHLPVVTTLEPHILDVRVLDALYFTEPLGGCEASARTQKPRFRVVSALGSRAKLTSGIEVLPQLDEIL